MSRGSSSADIFTTPEDFSAEVRKICANRHCTALEFATLIRNYDAIPNLPQYPYQLRCVQDAFELHVIDSIAPFINTALHILTISGITEDTLQPYLLRTLGKAISQSNEIEPTGTRIVFPQKIKEQPRPDIPEHTDERVNLLSSRAPQKPEHIISVLANFVFALSIGEPRILKARDLVADADKEFASRILESIGEELNTIATKAEARETAEKAAGKEAGYQEWQERRRYAAENFRRIVDRELIVNTCAAVRVILSLRTFDPEIQAQIEATVHEIVNAGALADCTNCQQTTKYLNARSLWKLIEKADATRIAQNVNVGDTVVQDA